MSQFTEKLLADISKIRARDLIYPGITFLVFILIGFIFFLAATFLAKNINDAFSSESIKKEGTLNITDYTLVAKKLGIHIAPQAKSIPTSISTTTPPDTPTIEIPIVLEKTQTVDKRSLTINILNSTQKNGGAGVLAEILEATGFGKAVTGNEKNLYATTTIFVKMSKGAFIPLLLEEVRRVYPEALATSTPENTLFDATIIIGSK